MSLTLVIGNKNYSSWSLRPWLLLQAHGIPFNEVQESLKQDGLSERLAQYSESRKVPVLIDETLTVWDSLAICEYVSEAYLFGKGWPRDAHDRARARALTAEMHSSFGALREELPMNCRAQRRVDISDNAKRDVARIDALWSEFAAEDNRGDWRLFGGFSITDCFYAPVVMRFWTYGIELSEPAKRYADSLFAHPALQMWVQKAQKETEVVPEDEAGIDV